MSNLSSFLSSYFIFFVFFSASYLCLVFSILLSITYTAVDATSLDDTVDCSLPYLPSEIIKITTIESSIDKVIHIHGLYRIGSISDKTNENGDLLNDIVLFFSEDYEMRIAVSAYDAKTVDLYLFQNTSLNINLFSKPVQFSVQQGDDPIERMIFALIKANTSYTLRLAYKIGNKDIINNINLQDESTLNNKCDKILVEFALQPRILAPHFKDACEENNVGIVPNIGLIMPNKDSKYHYQYHSSLERPNAFWYSIGGKNDKIDFKLIAQYNISVPYLIEHSNRWKFSLSMQSRFLDGGDIAAFVTAGNVAYTNEINVTKDENTNYKGYINKLPTISMCEKQSNSTNDENRTGADFICEYGMRSLKNHFIIQTELSSAHQLPINFISNANKNSSSQTFYSNYTLWFVERRSESAITDTCAPYSVDISLFPVVDNGANYINCNIDPIPTNLGVPGIFDTVTGIFHFSQRVLINFSSSRYEISFKPVKNSVFRSSVSPHPSVDVDIGLYDPSARKIVASSVNVNGPDGIIYFVNANQEYVLLLDFPFIIKRYETRKDYDYSSFCESFHLKIDIVPNEIYINDNRDKDCIKDVKPNLDYLQKKLDEGNYTDFGSVDFSSFPFKFQMIKTFLFFFYYLEQTIFRWEFVIKKQTFISFLVNSDPTNALGQVSIELLYKDKVFNQKNLYNLMYGEPTTLGQVLFTTLNPGIYMLVLRTPPMQILSYRKVQMAKIPICLKYGLHLSFSPFAPKCANAIAFPEIFPDSKSLSPHHFEEEFRIKFKSQLMTLVNLDANVGPRILHLLVEKSPDPVEILLFNNKSRLIAKSSYSSSMSGISELYALLTGNYYDVTFAFGNDLRDEDGACRSVKIQMSLKNIPNSSVTAGISLPEMENQRDLSLITASPFQYGPITMKIICEGHRFTKRKRITFEVSKFSVFRATVEFNFVYHVLGIALCRCEDDQNIDDKGIKSHKCTSSLEHDSCTTSVGYYNGVEISPTILPPGKYKLVLKTSIRFDNTDKEEIELKSFNQNSFFKIVPIYLQFSIHDVPADNKISAETPSPVVPEVIGDKGDVIPDNSNATDNDDRLCPADVQYLPHTLNNVAFIWPLYKDWTHFFQRLLIPKSNTVDYTHFSLTKECYVRINIPRSIIKVTVEIFIPYCRHSGCLHIVYSPSAEKDELPFSVTLPKGDYILTITYDTKGISSVSDCYPNENGVQPRTDGTTATSDTSSCLYVPFELSIVPIKLMKALAESYNDDKTIAAQCTNKTDWPDSVTSAGWTLTYRNTSEDVNHVISFSIKNGEENNAGIVYFDIRYQFITSGPVVYLEGLVPRDVACSSPGSFLLNPDGNHSTSKDKSFVRFSPYSYNNRLTFYRFLPEGSYNLVIKDRKTISNDFMPNCVPYSFSLFAMNITNKTNRNQTLAPSVLPLPIDDLPCLEMRISEIPSRFEMPAIDDTSIDLPRIESRGSHYRIPFSEGSLRRIGESSRYFVQRTISIPSPTGYIIRVWGQTHGHSSMSISLYNGKGQIIATSKSFGGYDATLTHEISASHPPRNNGENYRRTSHNDPDNDDADSNSNDNYKLVLTFFFDRAPKYKVDYFDCNTKSKLITLQFYLAIFPKQDFLTAFKCNFRQKMLINNLDKRYLPQTITMKDKFLHLYKDSFITSTDISSVDEADEEKFPGVPEIDTLKAKTEILFKTNLIIPKDIKNVTMISSVLYNMKWLNVRSAIFKYTDPNEIEDMPIARSLSTPLPFYAQEFNAKAFLITGSFYNNSSTYLQPGNYVFTLKFNLAQSFLKNTDFCINFSFNLLFFSPAEHPINPDPTGKKTQIEQKPSIIDVIPSKMDNLDPSDSLSIEVFLSADSDKSLYSSAFGTPGFAWLESFEQDINKGHYILPTDVYFTSPRLIKLKFPDKALKWQTKYVLRLDGSRLRTLDTFGSAKEGLIFSDDLITPDFTSYTTAYCGCNSDGHCAAGGACSCTEPDGVSCFECEPGSILSKEMFNVPMLNIPSHYCLIKGIPPPPLWTSETSHIEPTSPLATTRYNFPTDDTYIWPTHKPTMTPDGKKDKGDEERSRSSSDVKKALIIARDIFTVVVALILLAIGGYFAYNYYKYIKGQSYISLSTGSRQRGGRRRGVNSNDDDANEDGSQFDIDMEETDHILRNDPKSTLRNSANNFEMINCQDSKNGIRAISGSAIVSEIIARGDKSRREQISSTAPEEEKQHAIEQKKNDENNKTSKVVSDNTGSTATNTVVEGEKATICKGVKEMDDFF